MELHYPPEWDTKIEEQLKSAGVAGTDCLVGIHAGWGGREQAAAGRTRLRSWPVPNFAELARWLVTNVKAKVVLTGSAADEQINKAIRDSSGTDALNLAGRMSLLETAALIRRLSLYITVDSGPAHMAAALGTPLVTLWGPGILAQTAPLAGRGPVRILHRDVHCAPCYGTSLMKTCVDNICMKQILLADVQQAVEQMLALKSVQQG